MQSITRVPDVPLKCSMTPLGCADKPYHDAREQTVKSEPRSVAPPIDLYRATPASIAHAKARAAEERAEALTIIRATIRRQAKAQLRELVSAHGLLDVRTMLEEIEGE